MKVKIYTALVVNHGTGNVDDVRIVAATVNDLEQCKEQVLTYVNSMLDSDEEPYTNAELDWSIYFDKDEPHIVSTAFCDELQWGIYISCFKTEYQSKTQDIANES